MIFEWNSQTTQQPGGIHSMIGENFTRMGFLKKCSNGVMVIMLCLFMFQSSSVYADSDGELLKRSETASDTTSQQKLLSEARDRVEQFKVAELKDYFQDECVVAYRPHTTQLDIVSQSAVVIYPILLPDRIDMLIKVCQAG
jgi:hypothetical protein